MIKNMIMFFISEIVRFIEMVVNLISESRLTTNVFLDFYLGMQFLKISYDN